MNSMSYWMNKNHKSEPLKYVYDQYGIDAAGLQEVCINWSTLPTSKTIAQILRSKAEDIRSVASHNKREGKEENIGKSQRVGTATILREGLTTYVVGSGTDETGLGRWSWYKVEGEKGHKSYVITAYTPCGKATSKPRTYYKQHGRG